MAHADDATKSWVSAIPQKNDDGNVIEWICKYKYTLNSKSHTFDRLIKIDTPSKAPSGYTKAELLTFMDTDHMDKMFTRKYTEWTKVVPVITTDNSFDVCSLSES